MGFKPLVQALLDYQNGSEDATVVFHRDDGLSEALPIRFFFRNANEFSRLEQTAIELCRGRILEVDPFAGSHCLALQSLGRKVCALGWTPEAQTLLDERGLLDARHGKLAEVEERCFDTVFRVAPGVGLVEDLRALRLLLKRCRKILKEDGQVLLQSRNVFHTNNPLNIVYSLLNQNAGRQPGEVRMRIEYDGRVGPPVRWLHIEADGLRTVAEKDGWHCEVVAEDTSGNYLARLS